MKHFLLLATAITMIFLSSGCANTYDKNPRYPSAMEKEYIVRDKKFCEALSEGVTPSPEMIPVPQPYSVTTTGTMQTNVTGYSQRSGYTYGNATSTYRQRTTANNDAAAFNAGMQNLGAGLGAMARRNKNYNDCMEIIGWKKEENFTNEMYRQQEVNNKIYEKIRELQKDELYQYVIDYIFGYIQGLPSGERELVYKKLTTNVDEFEEAYQNARPKVQEILTQDQFVPKKP